MGWLRLVGSLKSYVSFAKEPYKRDDILQKRHIILRSLLILANPYIDIDNLLRQQPFIGLWSLQPTCAKALMIYSRGWTRSDPMQIDHIDICRYRLCMLAANFIDSGRSDLVRLTQSIVAVPLLAAKFPEIFLLIAWYKCARNCPTIRFYNLYIPQHCWVVHFHPAIMVGWKCFVPVRYQPPKGTLSGMALQSFRMMDSVGC